MSDGPHVTNRPETDRYGTPRGGTPRTQGKARSRGVTSVSALVAAAVVTAWLAGGGVSCAEKGVSNPRAAHAEDVTPALAAAFEPRVLSVEEWMYDGAPGRIFRTDSYAIYTTSSNKTIAERMPLFMEHALAHYSTALVDLPRPRDPMKTYLFANRPEWARMTQRVMGNDAGPYLQIQRGGFSSQGTAVLYDIGIRDTFAIAAHEGWHQYTQSTFRVPLPVWLEEGLATYMEGFRWDALRRRPPVPEASATSLPQFQPWYNWERYVALTRAARANRLMPLERLVETTPQELVDSNGDRALAYYAQVWAMTLYLAEGESGSMRGGLEEMLADASSGRLTARVAEISGERGARLQLSRRRGDVVLRTYFGKSAAEMEEGYRAFVAEIAKTGSRQWIAQGKSPVDNAEPAPAP